MSAPERSLLHRPRLRALLFGAVLVIALAFFIPYFNLSLGKFDWAFRPLCVGPIFFLVLLIWPINAVLLRARPGWAFRRSELLLMYAMMAICAALSGEGLYGYAVVNSVHPQYYATRENRWGELFLRDVPTWLQVTQPEAVRWYFEGAPPGAALPWSQWFAPVLAWSVFAFALYVAFFCLSCLMRKDWIEGQRLMFPFAVLPLEVVGESGPGAAGSFFRNPYMWAGLSLPVVQSLFQMAHSFAPAVPYSPFYWQIGRWFGNTGPWGALQNTYAYIGFETIGILALLPAELSLSLWLFFIANRAQVFAFAALGFGQEGLSARVFSPSEFIAYQEVGGCLMLALLLLWQSRRMIAAAFGSLIGRRAPSDPLDPLSPRGAAVGLVLSGACMVLWARRTGMDTWVFVALMAIFFAYSLSLARMVAAGGIYVPSTSMAPRDVLMGLTGAAGYSTASLAMVTYLQQVFMVQFKVNWLHYSMNDLKVLHSARIAGRVAALALLIAMVLMMGIVPWVDIHAAYSRGALLFDSWNFRDAGMGQFGELAASLHTPEAAMPYLPLGLACGAAVMYLLNWLHTSFLWWGISPIGFLMGGTWAMNTRIWTSAFIAWLLVFVLRRFGGLRLYRQFRPTFLGMALGHFMIMAVRSVVDPMLGLWMQLSPWA